jgi:hypothetical protein
MSNTIDNPNENCLDGMACPKCGSYGPFKIMATQSGMVTVSDDGTDDDMDGGVEWEDGSRCECIDCGHEATVGAFSGEEPEGEAPQQQNLVDVLIDIQALLLDMGRTIRALDEDGDHSEYWNQDGEYIADDRFRALEALIRGERIQKGGGQ